MANRKITLELRARNALASGLKSAGAALQKFGQSAMRIGRFFVKSFLIAGAAVAGFAAKAISAYAKQEAAERAVAASIEAYGESSVRALPKLKAIAAAIQDETGVSDEATLAGMAKMRMLGVQTSRLGEAAKAVVALKAVGLEEAAAQKAVAMAMQGSYEMLNRYVPALRAAKTEQEKAWIVNELFARGYEQQKAVLDTVAGRWAALKGRIGDLLEVVGEAIDHNDTLKDSLHRAGEAVKAFGQRIADWIKSGGVENLISFLKHFGNEAKHRFMMASNSARVAFSAMSDGAESAFNYLSNIVKTWAAAFVAQWKYVGDYAAAIWKKIRDPTSDFKPPSVKPYLGALSDYGRAVLGEGALVSRRTEEALKEREALQREYAERAAEIEKERAKRLAEAQEKGNDGADSGIVAESEEDIAKRKALQQRQAALEKSIAEERRRLAQARVDQIKEELRLRKELARRTVQAYIDEARAAREAKKVEREEAQRGQRLLEKVRRGTRLGRKDREFFQAFQTRRRDRAAESTLEKQLSEAGGNLSALQSEKATLQNMYLELVKIKKELVDNLQMG